MLMRRSWNQGDMRPGLGEFRAASKLDKSLCCVYMRKNIIRVAFTLHYSIVIAAETTEGITETR